MAAGSLPRAVCALLLAACCLSVLPSAVSAQRCGGGGRTTMLEMESTMTERADHYSDDALVEVAGVAQDPICGQCGWFCWWEYVPGFKAQEAALQRCDCLEREENGEPTPGSIHFCQEHAGGHLQAAPLRGSASNATRGQAWAGDTSYKAEFGPNYAKELPERQQLDDIAADLHQKGLITLDEGRMLAYVQCNMEATYTKNDGGTTYYPRCAYAWPHDIVNVYHESNGEERVARFAKLLSKQVIEMISEETHEYLTYKGDKGFKVGPNGAEKKLRDVLSKPGILQSQPPLKYHPATAEARAKRMTKALRAALMTRSTAKSKHAKQRGKSKAHAQKPKHIKKKVTRAHKKKH